MFLIKQYVVCAFVFSVLIFRKSFFSSSYRNVELSSTSKDIVLGLTVTGIVTGILIIYYLS